MNIQTYELLSSIPYLEQRQVMTTLMMETEEFTPTLISSSEIFIPGYKGIDLKLKVGYKNNFKSGGGRQVCSPNGEHRSYLTWLSDIPSSSSIMKVKKEIVQWLLNRFPTSHYNKEEGKFSIFIPFEMSWIEVKVIKVKI